MIWRSTLVFLTSLVALTVPVESLRAEGKSQLVAQTPIVEPSHAVDTGQTGPNVSAPTTTLGGQAGGQTGAADGSLSPAAPAAQQVEELKAIQRELKKRGYYNGPIDGIYGPNTAAAIQALRQGQVGGGVSPSPVAPTSPSLGGTNTPNSPTAVESAPDIFGGSALGNDGVQINGEQAGTEPDAISIGEEVSPDIGVTAENAAAADTAAVDGADRAEPTTGLGQLLWPGLVLMAALGSFGIGFILSGRFRPRPQDDSPSSAERTRAGASRS